MICGCDAVADLSAFDDARLAVRDAGSGASGSSGKSGSSGTSGSSVATGSSGTSSGGTTGTGTSPDDAGVADATMPGETSDGGGDDGTMAIQDSGSGGSTVDAFDAGPPNLLINPGFEEGTSPWTTFTDTNGHSALLQTSKNFPHSGTYSGWVSERTQTFQGAVQDITRVFVMGQTYTMSAYTRIEVASDAGADAPADAGPMVSDSISLTVEYTCRDDAGTETTTYTPFTSGLMANNLSWTQATGTLPPITCFELDAISVYVEGPAPSNDLYVDDLVLTVKP
ncbi:MAG TPA: carbohydrate binding domain-containing protein [Polyangiaceae bacterium]|nr:carbohydrate binding domain-containing protein [Polyangiaceae bacterium]